MNERLRVIARSVSIGGTEIDYTPDIADMPSFPDEPQTEFYKTVYKSDIGNFHYEYYKGQGEYWDFHFDEVSENCMATFEMMFQGFAPLLPRYVVYWGTMDGGTVDTNTLYGTCWFDQTVWRPRETVNGVWNFNIRFRKFGSSQ